MTVAKLLNTINELLNNGKLSLNSNVTVHAYVRDGMAVEWRGDDVIIECFGPNGDGLQINVDTEGSGLFYCDKYDSPSERNKVIKQLSDFKDKDGNPYFNNEFLKSKYSNNSCG